MTRDPHSDTAHSLYGLWRTAEQRIGINKARQPEAFERALSAYLQAIEDAARATNCWREFNCLRGGMVVA